MIFLPAAVLLLFICLFPEKADALPQFPIRFGLEIHEEHPHGNHGEEERPKTMDCRACHVNPTGGGMRNAHGRRFALEKLPMHPAGEDYEGFTEQAAITPFLDLGIDFRLAYLHAQSESTSAYRDTFFPMQADLYVSFAPTSHLAIYYQDGLQGNKEAFGLIHGLPRNAHLKVGKFIPPYGLKLDDHTSFIREKLGFGNTFGTESESGVEVGFADSLGFGNAAVFNGSGPAPNNNREKGFSATGGIKHPAFWLAGSYYHNVTGSGGSRVTREYAGFYAAGRFHRFYFLGERDWIFNEGSGAAELDGYADYLELDAVLLRGVVAKVKYDGYDPDRDGAGDRLQRITFCMDVYPHPFTEIFLQYRRNMEEADRDNDQILVMIHLFF